MSDLFQVEPRRPLAEALRPKTLAEVIGQTHLLGEGKPLRSPSNPASRIR
jgi:putative ATPase